MSDYASTPQGLLNVLLTVADDNLPDQRDLRNFRTVIHQSNRLPEHQSLGIVLRSFIPVPWLPISRGRLQY